MVVKSSKREDTDGVTATNYGLGKHIEEQKPEWRKPYQQSMLVAAATYNIAAAFIRLSLLYFYLRIIQNRTFRLFTHIMIAISVSFGIGSVVAVGCQCVPLKMLWDQTAKGSCVDIVTFYFANAGIHISTEFIIYVLPIPTLWSLHLPTRQKLGLCALMGIGAMLIIVSCYRIATLQALLHSTNVTCKYTRYTPREALWLNCFRGRCQSPPVVLSRSQPGYLHSLWTCFPRLL
jgi:hypothetical protein